MKSDRHWPVVIVGGGFSGTILAAQLARRGIRSVIVEATDRAGRGTAYSTTDPAHLLNVPAANMGAWADEPGDFAAHSGDPAAFAARRDYGAYLRGILDEALASGATVESGRAVGARPTADGGWTVDLADGDPITGEALVLAIGNQPPQTMAALRDGGERVIENPWSVEARSAVAEVATTDAPVLIVGTGLTMVDVMLSLDSAGHGGRIVALSRRGLIPRGHAAYEAQPIERSALPAGGLNALFAWLRHSAAALGSWRAAIDRLRPHSQYLWQSLPPGEQQRFLRHARPWWDVHRHRIAPQVSAKLAGMIDEGRLEIVAGRLAHVEPQASSVRVGYRRRGDETLREGEFAYVFNCTGPLGRIEQTRDPLLRQLLDDGLARPDPLGIGIAVDERSAVAGAAHLWALGPLTKGRFWEIIAVPDIRNQAAQVADDIARELGR
ncbi:NAD(P)-binding protein [Sphingomonas sinipercae]|uniref:NAD(P)-binding protein n=1 Tax=Sphingomonas sinipercae TaxID=2714944 RepID=A0A6G7ZMS7_9SPHN|nr:FAD/NAD(P)-binding protein [Sphingomonas sinipercae]QIL02297.1 NAD(P)-binding protein [Sphingomonas sinipercae]